MVRVVGHDERKVDGGVHDMQSGQCAEACSLTPPDHPMSVRHLSNALMFEFIVYIRNLYCPSSGGLFDPLDLFKYSSYPAAKDCDIWAQFNSIYRA